MSQKRRKTAQAPRIDPAFETTIRAAFAELSDLEASAPVTVEPYADPTMADVTGTLWDGRPHTETYRHAGDDLFLVKNGGTRYRIVAGEFWVGGRKRTYAAFLAN